MSSVRSLSDLGTIGLWSRATEDQSPADARMLVRRYESAGVPVVWIPEGLGYEALTHASLLLSASTRIAVATGIANMWARDAYAAHAGTRLLRAAHDDRFLLGLGVSHRLVVESVRNQGFQSPIATLVSYLDRLDQLDSREDAGPRVIAALGPRMLDLAAERGLGVLTYLTTADHTRSARQRLGSAHLSVHLPVVADTDASRARTVARSYLAPYLALENYRISFQRQGYHDGDLDDGGSDRLVDALVTHGTIDRILAAVQTRQSAGADHVALQPLDQSSTLAVLESFAP